MRNKYIRKKRNLSYYARIVIVISLTLLIYGAILDINNDKRLYDPVKDVEQEEKSTINITTADGSEIIPGNTTTSTENSANTINNDNTNNTENTNTNTNTNTPNNKPIGSNKNTNKNSPTTNNTNKNPTPNNNQVQNNTHVLTLAEINNNLRTEIQNTYGISVKYGNETDGYTVQGISTSSISDENTINSNLNKLKQALSLYPNGFLAEIKNGGIPLTVMLINNYSENSITGVTDSSYKYAVISIAVTYPFEESFYHESYHYIERYMFKKGANFNTWNSLNPEDFTYGNINNNLSYSNTFSPDAPFVNNYAQTSPEEDRASTFEYMMASSKASCLNKETIVWNKATVMKNTIEAVYNTVSPNRVEYWERYL